MILYIPNASHNTSTETETINNYKKKTENKELERTQKSLFVTDKQRGFKKRNEIVVGRERETYLCLRDEIAECKTV